MNWSKPFGRTWTFWLGSLSTSYTAMAGLWATLPSAWVPTLGEAERWILAGIGVLLAGSVVMAHRIESAPKLPAPPSGNDFHQGA
ncbi:MAG TPA: hypothetical protein VFP92_00840 [Rhodanobacteraceae bacterium]|nr:hypothetical protein [Rhodanobacteraceae bacterium]